MPANVTSRRRADEPWPVRGSRAGRDPWDESGDAAELRAEREAAERRLEAAVLRTRRRMAAERRRQERQRRQRRSLATVQRLVR